MRHWDRLRPYLHRLLSMIGLTVVAGSIAFAILWIWEPQFEKVSGALSTMGVAPLVLTSIIIAGAISWNVGHGRWLAMLGLRHFFQSPPLWVGIAIGGIWTLTLNWLASGKWPTVSLLWFVLLGIFLMIVFAVSLLPQLQARFKPIQLGIDTDHPTQTVTEWTFEKIVTWITNDDPICTRADDRFDHYSMAEHISQLLYPADNEHVPVPSIAVVGDLGAGKSTLLNLVCDSLKERGIPDTEITIVPISVWKYETPRAAVSGILSAVISKLGEHVNILSLTHLPDDYVYMIEKVGGRFGSLARILSNKEDPIAILKRLDDVAAAIGLRVVVWIEDIERFSGSDQLGNNPASLVAEAERIMPIRSMLYHLDQSKQIGVITADVSLDSRIDVQKIARYVERIPPLSPEQVWTVLSEMRTGWLDRSHYPFTDPASVSVRQQFSFSQSSLPGSLWRWRRNDNSPRAQESVALLLRTPRALKSTLRAIHAWWSLLAGEIDLDDLIVISTIRSARPALFSFINEHIDWFCYGKEIQIGPKREVDGVQTELDALINREPNAELRNALTSLLGFIFSRLGKESYPRSEMDIKYAKPQGLERDGYWQKYIHGIEVDLSSKDQLLIEEIMQWKQRQDNTLIERIIAKADDSRVPAFSRLFAGESRFRLLDDVCRELLSRVNDTPDLEDSVQAIRTVESVIHVFQRNDQVLSNVISRWMLKAVPINLTFAYELFHVFGFMETSPGSGLLSQETTQSLHEELLTRIVAEFTSSKGDKLAKSLRGAEPWLVHWIWWTLDRIRQEKTSGVPNKKWPAFSQILIEAAESDPITVLPQCIVIVTHGTMIDKKKVREDGSQYPSLEYGGTFEKSRMEELFGKGGSRQLLKLIRQYEPPKGTNPQFLPLYESVKEVAMTENDLE